MLNENKNLIYILGGLLIVSAAAFFAFSSFSDSGSSANRRVIEGETFTQLYEGCSAIYVKGENTLAKSEYYILLDDEESKLEGNGSYNGSVLYLEPSQRAWYEDNEERIETAFNNCNRTIEQVQYFPE